MGGLRLCDVRLEKRGREGGRGKERERERKGRAEKERERLTP